MGAESLIACALQKHFWWLTLDTREPGFQAQTSTGFLCDLVTYPLGAPASLFLSVVIPSAMYVCMHVCPRI